MRRLLLVLLLLSVGCSKSAEQEDLPKPDTAKQKEYFEQEKIRQEQVAKQIEQEQTNKEQEKIKQQQLIEQAKAMIEEKNKKLAFIYFDFQRDERIRLNDKKHIPELDRDLPLTVGLVMPVSYLRVIQIVSHNTFLAQIKDNTVMAVGWGTSNLVDGELIGGTNGKPLGIKVIGTQDYKTVLGANKRVYVVEPFDLYAYEAEWLAQQQPKEPADAPVEAPAIEEVKEAITEERKWSTKLGLNIGNGQLVKIEGNEITIKFADGKEIAVDRNKLSQADIDYIEERETKEAIVDEQPAVESPAAPKETPKPLVARKWSNTTGTFTVIARLVSIDGKTVTLKKVNGQEITTTIDKLSENDQLYIEEHKNAEIFGN